MGGQERENLFIFRFFFFDNDIVCVYRNHINDDIIDDGDDDEDDDDVFHLILYLFLYQLLSASPYMLSREFRVDGVWSSVIVIRRGP